MGARVMVTTMVSGAWQRPGTDEPQRLALALQVAEVGKVLEERRSADLDVDSESDAFDLNGNLSPHIAALFI